MGGMMGRKSGCAKIAGVSAKILGILADTSSVELRERKVVREKRVVGTRWQVIP